MYALRYVTEIRNQRKKKNGYSRHYNMFYVRFDSKARAERLKYVRLGHDADLCIATCLNLNPVQKHETEYFRRNMVRN